MRGAVLAMSRWRNRCWKEEMKETIREERQICPGVMGLWGKIGTVESGKNSRESRVKGLSCALWFFFFFFEG
jgi:hypothetical protein